MEKGLGVGTFEPRIRHELLEYYNIPNKKNKINENALHIASKYNNHT
jgi:hypothetical protein